MQFDLIAIGRRMPAWIDSAFCEYSKRLPESINFNLIEVAPATRSKNKNSEQLKKIEEEKINAVIAPGNIVIALDEKGNATKATNKKALIIFDISFPPIIIKIKNFMSIIIALITCLYLKKRLKLLIKTGKKILINEY